MEPNTYQSATDAEGTNPTPAPAATETTEATPAATNRTLMGILSYIGILVIVPYLMAKDDAVVKFHIKQGLVLVVIMIIAWLGKETMPVLTPLYALVNIALFVLSVIGIVNVIQKKENELPLVGQFAKHFNNI